MLEDLQSVSELAGLCAGGSEYGPLSTSALASVRRAMTLSTSARAFDSRAVFVSFSSSFSSANMAIVADSRLSRWDGSVWVGSYRGMAIRAAARETSRALRASGDVVSGLVHSRGLVREGGRHAGECKVSTASVVCLNQRYKMWFRPSVGVGCCIGELSLAGVAETQ